MQRHLGVLAPATALLSCALALYACSSDSPSATNGPDGGPLPGADGSSGGDGSSDPDARVDGNPDPDGAVDGAVEGEAAVDADIDAGPPVVRFIGRFDMAAAGGPKVAWPGAQIIARFSGTTEVKATFNDVKLYGDYGPDRWEVLVDGASAQIISPPQNAQTTFSLASGLSMAAHTVEVVKLTEGSVGTAQFFGFDFTGGTLLPPPPALKRHMQFLGDSGANGYGVDGVAPCSFSGATQNERKSYPALIAHDLLADHHNLGASGKGVSENYTPGDNDVFSVLYPLTGVYSGAPAWAYADYTPDVVWITLGGNDFDGAQAPASPPTFETAYNALVGTIRTQHPGAHIFCAVAPSLTGAAYTNVKTRAQNVVGTRNGGGDAKVYFFEFARSQNGETTACDGHVNAAKHRTMADEAITLIKQKTGW